MHVRFAVEGRAFLDEDAGGVDVAVQRAGTFQHGAFLGVDVALDGAEDDDGLRFDAGFDVDAAGDGHGGGANDFAVDFAGDGAFVGELQRADDFDVGRDVSVVLRRGRAGHRRGIGHGLRFGRERTVGEDGGNGAPLGPALLPAIVIGQKITRAEEDGDFLGFVRAEGLAVFGDEEGHGDDGKWIKSGPGLSWQGFPEVSRHEVDVVAEAG